MKADGHHVGDDPEHSVWCTTLPQLGFMFACDAGSFNGTVVRSYISDLQGQTRDSRQKVKKRSGL